MACFKGQGALEYFLLLTIACILLVAVGASASHLESGQDSVSRNAYLALENFTAVDDSSQNLVGVNDGGGWFEIDVASFEPYISGQSAFFEVRVYCPGKMWLNETLITVKNSAGQNVRVEPSRLPETRVYLAKSYSAQFYPSEPGIYSIKAVTSGKDAAVDVLVR